MPKRPYAVDGTVESIVRDGLCTECGFCEPICPTDAIRMEVSAATGEILPIVTPDQCVMCPLCLAVCPGDEVDFDKHYRERFGVTDYHKYSGYAESVYLAHATDYSHRFSAASGGVLTVLAAFALEQGLLDYVLFARPRKDDPFRTETVLTDDPAEFAVSHGSIYFPVPLGEGARLLLDRDVPADAKLGLIGLPCHIHAALDLVELGRFKRFEWELIFGIFCGGTWTYKAIDAYLKTRGLNREELSEFAYRGEGWPGKIAYATRDGRRFVEERHNPALVERIDRASIFSANSFYTPHRCLTCSDGLAELADIAFGDPWLDSERGDEAGRTIIVVRNAKARRLLERARDAGIVALEDSDTETMVVSQKGMLTFKQNFAAFNTMVRWLGGKRAPRYTYRWLENDRPPRVMYLYTFIAYMNHLIARRGAHRLVRVPLAVVQGLVAKLIKKHLLRLTPRDHENYFD